MNPGLLIVLLFLAFIATEGIVEYLLGTLFDKSEKLKDKKWVLMYVSALVGIGLAGYYNVDAVAAVFSAAGFPNDPSWLGLGITGVLIGRGANFVNDIWQRFFPK